MSGDLVGFQRELHEHGLQEDPALVISQVPVQLGGLMHELQHPVDQVNAGLEIDLGLAQLTVDLGLLVHDLSQPCPCFRAGHGSIGGKLDEVLFLAVESFAFQAKLGVAQRITGVRLRTRRLGWRAQLQDAAARGLNADELAAKLHTTRQAVIAASARHSISLRHAPRRPHPNRRHDLLFDRDALAAQLP